MNFEETTEKPHIELIREQIITEIEGMRNLRQELKKKYPYLLVYATK